MKTVGTVALVATLTLALLPAHGQEKKADTVAELKTLDAKLTEAFKARDFELLGKHIEDGFIIVDPRGHTHNKQKYLKHLADGTAKFKDLKETDVKVRLFGETAVITGLLEIKGEEKDVVHEYRWTRVYHKKGDDWLCVFEQHTHVHPPKEKDKPKE